MSHSIKEKRTKGPPDQWHQYSGQTFACVHMYWAEIRPLSSKASRGYVQLLPKLFDHHHYLSPIEGLLLSHFVGIWIKVNGSTTNAYLHLLTSCCTQSWLSTRNSSSVTPLVLVCKATASLACCLCTSSLFATRIISVNQKHTFIKATLGIHLNKGSCCC